MRDELKTKERLVEELKYLRRQNEQLKQKLAEYASRENEAQFRSYIDKAPDGIFIIDKFGSYIDANPAACDSLGYTKEELLKLSVKDIRNGDGNHFKELLREGFAAYELELKKKDGQLLTVELHGVQLTEDSYIGYARDVTDRKLAEEALKKSEAKFKSYINESPDGVTIVDKDGRFKEVNPAACNIMGYSQAELLSMSITDIAVCKDTQFFKDLVKYGKVEAEIKNITKDGKIITVDIRAVALGNDHYLGFLRDVTSRKKIEEDLKESEKYHNLIINNISDLVLLYEVESAENFRVRKANDKCLEIIGRKEEEVIGKLIQEIMPPEVAARLIKNDRQAVIEGVTIRREDIFPFGQFDTSFIPVADEEGKCKFLVVTSREISEKKKSEEHMLKIEKLETVGLLAGGIAHDFNNILTVITGNVSLAKMKMESLIGQQKNDILTILSEVEKASLQARKLTQQLLTFAKGDSPILKTASIGELIRESVSFALRGSNVKCGFNIPEDLWLAEIDEGQINQVIHNLVINADQAMPNGGIIDIYCENFTMNQSVALPIDFGQYVKVSIKDNGIGIPAKHLKNIFDPYFTTKQKGSGLGLTTVHSIIRKHGGCIIVESEQGSGTTFEVYLKASKAKKLTKSSQGKYPLSNASGRILLMDDQEMLLQVLSEMLNHIGYEVACAKDGEEAINLYKGAKDSDDPFDAVIMDLTIPGGMGGRETIKELIKYDPEVKTVVSSGYSEDRVMANYKRYGFKAVLKKPFSLIELSQIIKEVLNH